MTGRQLTEKRKAAGLTQAIAAQYAAVTWGTWQKWEKRGQLPIDIQAKAEGAIRAAINESLNGDKGQ